MAWELIAQGPDLGSVESMGVLDEIPHDTRFRVVIRTIWPGGYLADLPGMEQMAELFYSQSGAILEDVEGIDATTIVLHFRANAVQLLIFIGLLATILGLGAWLITGVDVEVLTAEIGNILKWGAIGVLGILGIYIATKAPLPQRR